MPHDTKNNPGKVTWDKWSRFRQEARRTAHSPEEFSDPDRTWFNLDSDDDISPAGITGQYHEDYDDGDSVGPTSDRGRPSLNLLKDIL